MTLVGFMRILSPVFCNAWKGRAVNVHPSLLPKHAALMDLEVHQSVLDASIDFEVQLRRYNYVTPKNYLTFIATYKKELVGSRQRNTELVDRLDGGLKKLIQAAKDVVM